MINPRYAAFRAISPDAPLYEFFAFIARAKRFAFDHDLGVVASGTELRVINHDQFTAACIIFASSQNNR